MKMKEIPCPKCRGASCVDCKGTGTMKIPKFVKWDSNAKCAVCMHCGASTNALLTATECMRCLEDLG